MTEPESEPVYRGSAVLESSMSRTDMAEMFKQTPTVQKSEPSLPPAPIKMEKRAATTPRKKLARKSDYETVMLVILETSANTGSEFRVGWVADKELEIGLVIDDEPNVPLLKRCFGESQVFYSGADAEAHAHQIFEARHQQFYNEGRAAQQSLNIQPHDAEEKANLYASNMLSGIRIRHLPMRWPD